jgi:hypothetical protein
MVAVTIKSNLFHISSEVHRDGTALSPIRECEIH